jgi:hypothetical protein
MTCKEGLAIQISAEILFDSVILSGARWAFVFLKAADPSAVEGPWWFSKCGRSGVDIR